MSQINWFPGHMAKAIREIDEKLKLIDLVIELVDARIPMTSSNPVLDKLIQDKPRLMILNKVDLADPNITNKWVKYLNENNIPNLTYDSKHQKNNKIVINKIYEILDSKIIQQQNKGIKNPKLKILVVGIPNVGKSTFINNLIQKSSAKTGNKPGVTKGQQWLKLDKNLDLVDTPGILWPKIETKLGALKLAFANTIKSEVLPLEDIANEAFIWLYNNYQSNLLEIYPSLKDVDLSKLDIANEKLLYEIFSLLQYNKYANLKNIDQIYNDFLNNLWNNKFGLISYETPEEFKKVVINE